MKDRIGIVGGGQLGRMLGFEAKKMGFYVTIIDPTPRSPAGQVVDAEITAGYSDSEATYKLATESNFITVEIEHINTGTLQQLVDKGIQVNPSPQTISMVKDKFVQKEFLRKNGIPTADFKEVTTETDIIVAGQEFGFPLLVKAKHNAYDGRRNIILQSKEQVSEVVRKLPGRQWYVEKFVPFAKELAIMMVRGIKGGIVSYPVVETIHKNNICHIVKAPAPVDSKIRKKAETLAIEVMQHLNGAGVFGIEMFLTGDSKVLVNEIAPRVHNSGHYTIEACFTSQFEQHIRAITGMPLGNPEMTVPAAVMINILGERQGPVNVKGMDKVLGMRNTYVHIYGKKDTKPERKMGHITVVGNNIEELQQKALKARNLISI